MRRVVDGSVGGCEWIHYISQAKENTAAKKKGRVLALII